MVSSMHCVTNISDSCEMLCNVTLTLNSQHRGQYSIGGLLTSTVGAHIIGPLPLIADNRLLWGGGEIHLIKAVKWLSFEGENNVTGIR